MNIIKPSRHRSKKLREQCRGELCRLMLSDQCGAEGTTIPAHVQLQGFGGIGTKPSDLFTVPMCQNCHDQYDGRTKSDLSADEIELIVRRDLQRWQQHLQDMELIITK